VVCHAVPAIALLGFGPLEKIVQVANIKLRRILKKNPSLRTRMPTLLVQPSPKVPPHPLRHFAPQPRSTL
jgi:hypothetical protein